MNKLISVIIPSYNVQEYICDCIDSILSEILENFEIIVVDDGSKDRTVDIVREKYPDIKLITQKNQGPSKARKVGLEKSKGEYILFIDSDDYVEKNYTREMYEEIRKTDSDIVVSPVKYYDGVDYIEVEEKKYDNETLEAESYLLDIFKGQHITSCSNKIYKKNILMGEIFLEKVKHGEDCYTLIKALLNSKHISFIKKTSYIYRKNLNSLTNRKRIPIEDYEVVYNSLEKELRKNRKLEKNIYIFKYNFLYILIRSKSIFSKRVLFDKEYRKIYFNYLEDIKNGFIDGSFGNTEKEKSMIEFRKKGVILSELFRLITRLRKREKRKYGKN
ncbi:MAG: glycosyltransferase family 2 protein [Cetobacterium sp.]